MSDHYVVESAMLVYLCFYFVLYDMFPSMVFGIVLSNLVISFSELDLPNISGYFLLICAEKNHIFVCLKTLLFQFFLLLVTWSYDYRNVMTYLKPQVLGKI